MEIGSAPGCEGCPGKDYCKNSTQEDKADMEKLDLRMKVIQHKILVMSGKGGVGKSTVSSLLALGLAEMGFKVGILDVDICGPSIPKLLNCENGSIVNKPWGWVPVTGTNNILVMSIAFITGTKETPVIWRGPRKTNMIVRFLKDTYWGKLDYLVIDTPPGTSDEHLSAVKSLSSSSSFYSLMVTTPQDLSISTVLRQINFCSKLKLPLLGIIHNMDGYACPCCGEICEIFEHGMCDKELEKLNVKSLGKIPIDPQICLNGDNGTSIFKDHPNSPLTTSFKQILQQITTLVKS
uniref:Cytosolic Fe-S cluster assembly factor NUBP1 homolog n=1 Tax=Arcella intermedia TaxID=1963864 RepID=A0A6B2LBR4_9EUKA